MWALAATLAIGVMLAGGAARAEPPVPLAESGHFFVGGRYVQRGELQLMQGQMYVEYRIPAQRRPLPPVVMIHGAAQTGTNFTTTPDGRPGWAEDFLRAGHVVYVVDQAGRGRSGEDAEAFGPYVRFGTRFIEQQFTGPELHRLWPQAERHSQWPGGPGRPGNAAFDQFYASQVAGIGNPLRVEEAVLDANLALLERIGPAVLLTHSQSGVFGWVLADRRPDLVRAIIAVEPNGPPLHDGTFRGGEDWYVDAGAAAPPRPPARPWGITRLPLTFEPPAAVPADLALVRQEAPDGPGLVRCWVQPSPARQLPRLRGIPIAVVTGEASYRATYDHCTARFLADAGATVEHIRLEAHGVPGNGHMMMLESNSAEIARVLLAWLERRVRP